MLTHRTLRPLAALLLATTVLANPDLAPRDWIDRDGHRHAGSPPSGWCRLNGRWRSTSCQALATVWIVIIVLATVIPFFCGLGVCIFLIRRRRRNAQISRDAAANRANNPYTAAQNPLMGPQLLVYQPYNPGPYAGANQYPPPRASYEPVALGVSN